MPTPETLALAERLAVAEVVVGWTCRPARSSATQVAGWSPAQWAAARQSALVHGVAPLLAERLAGGALWGRLDPDLRRYLAAQHDLSARRAALMLADMAEIQRAAAASGVAALPLKGAVLAADYYPAPGLRPMADLDLLVRPADEPGLAQVLAGLGYTLVEATPRHRSYHRGTPRVASYDGEHPDNPRCVEVHTGVAEHLRGMRLDLTEALWADARPSEPGGFVGLRPGAGALLQHLLIHTSHNLFNRRLRLIQLYDLALAAPRLSGADWAALLAQARHTGEGRMFYAPLALAERQLGPLAPPEVRDELAAATPRALRHQLARATPSELSLCNACAAPPAYKLAWYRPGRERRQSLLYVIVPAADELRQRYPRLGRWLPVAYLLHLSHVGRWAYRLALGLARRRAAAARAE